MSTEKNPLRAVIYSRVSTVDQNPENQIAQLKAQAQRNGWEVLEVVTDKESGSKSNKDRKGLDKVLNMADRGEYDILLFWSLDRLSREGTLKTLTYLERLTKGGVDWYSLQETYLRSLGDFGDAVIGILSTLAKQERLKISERTRAGLERARTKGKTLGRPAGKMSQKTIDRINAVKEHRSKGWTFTRIGENMHISQARASQLFKMECPLPRKK